MSSRYDLNRFKERQDEFYLQALEEIKEGETQSHWIWYIFPQLKGLGSSINSEYYGIEDIDEATDYLNVDLLRRNLEGISTALLNINGKTAKGIFGSIDCKKVHSSMTLFAQVPGASPVYNKVLEKYYHAIPDQKTIDLLNK